MFIRKREYLEKQEQIAELKEVVKKATRENNDTLNEMISVQELNRNLRSANEHLTSELEETRARFDQWRDYAAQLEEERADLTKELTTAYKLLDETRVKCDHLQAAIDEMHRCDYVSEYKAMKEYAQYLYELLDDDGRAHVEEHFKPTAPEQEATEQEEPEETVEEVEQ